jgi:hypothetical protein
MKKTLTSRNITWGFTVTRICSYGLNYYKHVLNCYRNHKNNLRIWLTSGSADGIETSSLLMPMESSSLGASTSFSALNVSKFSCKVMNKG